MRGIWIPIAIVVVIVIVGLAMFAPSGVEGPAPGIDPTEQSTPAGS